MEKNNSRSKVFNLIHLSKKKYLLMLPHIDYAWSTRSSSIQRYVEKLLVRLRDC